MNVAAGVVGMVFGLLHGLPSIARNRSPQAVRGSHDVAAIPVWARLLWLALSALTFAGGLLLLFSAGTVAAVLESLGAFGVLLLAVANGYWIHGRPTLSHHVVRGIAVAVLVALAILSAKG